MTFLRAAPAVLCTAILAIVLSPGAKADDYDKKTTVTFSEPVEIPPVYITGMRVLPAGTYVFKLINSSSNRHIVQIFNQDQTKIYATILAIPTYRLTPKDKTVITFNEGLRDQPEAIRAWFYPGANWGEEFVYPQTKAVELAKVTNSPVLALQAEVQPEVAKPEEPEVATALTQTPVVAVQPTGEVVELAQAIQTPPPASVAAVPSPASVAAAPEASTENRLPRDRELFPADRALRIAGARRRLHHSIHSEACPVARFVNSAPMFRCVHSCQSDAPVSGASVKTGPTKKGV